ncbi:MAG: hypothetical protein EON56_02680 [Alphaproteobacteria bacterium]|nr:MAG: hypothetical protein EON56_02680 [Alphaproteobacteria bacterium]
MATQKSTQAAPIRAIEALLGEITSAAYFTESLHAKLDVTEGDKDDEIHALRQVVARMGWMADMALHRLGSHNCLREGRAQDWLLTPVTLDAFRAGAQS